MRSLVSILATALLAAGCSSGAQDVQVGTETTPADPDPIPTAAVTTTTTSAPVLGDLHLDPASVLLTPSDVPAPWDLTGESEFDGYDIGPNQSDCDTYWTLDSVAAHPVASRLWFQPGANLDHDAFDAGVPAAEQLLAAAKSLPADCPSIRWNEGGALVVTHLPIAVDGVVSIQLTSDVGEVQWLAYAARANVVSRVRYVHFGIEPGAAVPTEALDDFARVVAAMARRLDQSAPETPTTTTSVAPAPPTTRRVDTTQPPDPAFEHPLSAALLTEDELTTGLEVQSVDPHLPEQATDGWIGGCPASESIVTLDRWFSLQQEMVGPGSDALQIVGRAPTAAAAETAVAQFAAMAECDPTLDEAFAETTFTGGVLSGIGPGTAAVLSIELPEGHSAVFVAYHVQAIVGVLLVNQAGSPPGIENHAAMLTAALERAAAL